MASTSDVITSGLPWLPRTARFFNIRDAILKYLVPWRDSFYP